MNTPEPDRTIAIFDAMTGETVVRELTPEEMPDFTPAIVLQEGI